MSLSPTRALLWSAALGLALSACSEPEAGSAAPPERAPAVLLITLDTTRADRLGFDGDRLARTPHLDALAARSTVFRSAITTAPLTLPAHTSMFSGLPPLAHGVHDNHSFRVPEALHTLPERLQEAGVQTAAVVAASVLSRESGIAQGLAHFDEVPPRLAALNIPERPAREITDAALRALQARDPSRPWFLWVHYFDPHAPYRAPELVRRRWRDRARRDPALRQLSPFELEYRAELEELDAQLGRLLAALDLDGPAAPTVLVVGDHGEGLDEHGEPTHGIFVHDSTLRVPLLLARPGGSAREVASPVSVTDVFPTLLECFGLQPPETAARSLLPATEGAALPADRPLLFETRRAYHEFGWCWYEGIRVGSQKLIEGPRRELYDLATDPGERHDLAAEEPRRVAELFAELERQRELCAVEAASLGSGVPREDAAAVAALGYLSTVRDEPESRAELPDPRENLIALRWRDEGYALLGAGRHDEALERFQRILDETDSRSLALKLLATCYGARADRREAVGDATGARQDLEAAREHWAAAVEEVPEHVLFRHNLAMLCFRCGDPDRGLELLQECVERAPDDRECWFQLGQEYARRGDAPAARRALRESLERAPRADDPRAAEARRMLESLGED